MSTIKKGQIVMTDAKIIEAAAKQTGAITPVPGRIGPMTIVCLLRNPLVAAARRHGVTIGKI
jgi:5,10-methylene-tetrahydrofolate dehydrogenase/methenyl tetrahydrofolate cyclohydrolase